MSEFEKELDAKIKSGEIMEERYKNGCIVSYFASFKDIVSTFKDWQPPKPLVVVPQIVADYIKLCRDNEESLSSVIYMCERIWKNNIDDAHTWVHNNEEDFIKAWLDGYTVEKEQLYEIRLPLPKNDDNDYALVDVKGYIWEDALPTKYKLTESEIKAIDERYWTFAVPVEEVEP